MTQSLTGGCVCGAVRYEIADEPLAVYACHCTGCQRITSSAFSIGVVVLDSAFRLSGKPAREAPGGMTEGGRSKTRLICGDCGTWLFGKPRPSSGQSGPVRVVRGGTLDDTGWLRPTTHYWTRSKQPWVMLAEDTEQFLTQPYAG